MFLSVRVSCGDPKQRPLPPIQRTFFASLATTFISWETKIIVIPFSFNSFKKE